MELFFYSMVFLLLCIGSFWLLGSLYGLFRSRKIYFPVSLAAKMAVSAVLGGFFFMIGGIVLSTLIFNADMQKRNDYERWPTVIAGTLISLLGSILTFFSSRWLIWDALQRGL